VRIEGAHKKGKKEALEKERGETMSKGGKVRRGPETDGSPEKGWYNHPGKEGGKRGKNLNQNVTG